MPIIDSVQLNPNNKIQIAVTPLIYTGRRSFTFTQSGWEHGNVLKIPVTDLNREPIGPKYDEQQEKHIYYDILTVPVTITDTGQKYLCYYGYNHTENAPVFSLLGYVPIVSSSEEEPLYIYI